MGAIKAIFNSSFNVLFFFLYLLLKLWVEILKVKFKFYLNLNVTFVTKDFPKCIFKICPFSTYTSDIVMT